MKSKKMKIVLTVILAALVLSIVAGAVIWNSQHRMDASETVPSTTAETTAGQMEPEVPAVTNLEAKTQEDGTILITWAAPGTDSPVTYTLWCSTAKNSGYEILAEGLTDLSWIDQTVEETATRWYRLTVTEVVDGIEYTSEPSGACSAAAVVGTVSSVTAELAGDNSVQITWDEYVPRWKGAVVSYSVWSAEQPDAPLAEGLTDGAWLHEKLPDLTDCTYTVTVQLSLEDQVSSGAHSAPSNTVITGVGAVSGLTASSPSSSMVEVCWDAYAAGQKNADGSDIEIRYQLYTCDSADGEYTLLAENLTDTVYSHTGLSSGSTHYYRVQVTAVKNEICYTGAISSSTCAVVKNAAVPNSDAGSSGNTSMGSSGNTSTGSSTGNTVAVGSKDSDSGISESTGSDGNYLDDDYVCSEDFYGLPYFPWGSMFQIERSEATLLTGDDFQIPYTYPGDSWNLSWGSNNPAVAAVNSAGYVMTFSQGVAMIRVTDGIDTLYFKVTVVNEHTAEEKLAAARNVAQGIAKSVMEDASLTTDLQRIVKAAGIVNGYVGQGQYSTTHPDYNTAYGTLVAGYSSCAGATQAMGLVLECMGFEWGCMNADQWDHQWCIVYDMDGQVGFADGSEYGIAGYGDRETGTWYTWDPYRGGVVLFYE